MPISNLELWGRIASYTFDDASAAWPFSHRLATENGWTRDFADRVIIEYKKFTYLACTSLEPVTPSDAVDQAWHLHLAYSREYWQQFCPNVLRQDLHHGPTRGGSEEDAKYRDWYLQTLLIYVGEFGMQPPSDIWPPSEARFSAPQFMKRIDTRANWILRRKDTRIAAAAMIVAVGTIIGCIAGYRVFMFGTVQTISFFIASLFGLIFVAAAITGSGDRNRGNRSGSGGCGAGCGGSGCGGGGGCGSGCSS